MITGKIFKYNKTPLGEVSCEEVGSFLVCRVVVGGQTLIQFPLSPTVDTNTIGLRVANVVRQTGLVVGQVDVEIDPVP